jgi:putative oxygen-independent coproporphyrinogen III oxidase
MASLIPPPLSLYIHLPWCVRKCPYCDFNSHAGKGALPFDAYIDALIADLDQDLPLVWGRVVNSVFFGGGTPSLFPPDAIARILDAASARLRFAPSAEVTLETNPGTAEHGRFDGYLKAGVNRLSFGIQSFNDAALEKLGRIHDSAQAETAVKLAQDAGFDNINLDLMYALPGQDLAAAEHDLERAFALQPAHISHYQLTLEPNTIFFARPPKGIPDEDAAWDIPVRGQRLCPARPPVRAQPQLLALWRLPGHRRRCPRQDQLRGAAADPAPLEGQAPTGFHGYCRHPGQHRWR